MTDFRIGAHCVLMLAGASMCAAGHAQASAAPTLAAASGAASDRAQRESERTLYWIRVLADKPAVPKATERRPAALAAPKGSRSGDAAAVASEAPLPSRGKTAPSVVGARSTATGADGGARPADMASDELGARAASPVHVSARPDATAAPTPTVSDPGPDQDVIATPEIDEPDPGLIMTKSADPKFPLSAMHRLRQGEVEVRFEVDPNGRVEDASVVKTSSPTLNNAALDAVRQWQFRPTPHGHTAVVDLAFNLDS
jgi:TonB family protein